jgi:hypothetical protein
MFVVCCLAWALGTGSPVLRLASIRGSGQSRRASGLACDPDATASMPVLFATQFVPHQFLKMVLQTFSSFFASQKIPLDNGQQ